MHKSKRPYLLPEPLLCDPDKIKNGIPMELVNEYIRKHEERLPRYNYLENLYKGYIHSLVPLVYHFLFYPDRIKEKMVYQWN